MARTVLQDVDRVLASKWYAEWALTHGPDDKKIKLERSGQRRPQSDDAWARTFIEAIRVGLAATPTPPPPPPPPPPPKLAPQTYNRGSSGQDARYCTTGLSKTDGFYVDAGGYRYDDNGLCLGGRSGNPVAGLKPADQMDGRSPCDPYTNGDQSFPPWPAASYDV